MLTLTFMIVAFTIITALLGFAFTASRTVNTYRTDRALRYAADAALETAVVKVKLDQSLGDTAAEEQCAVLSVDGTANALPNPRGLFKTGSGVRVTCQLTPNSPGGSYRDVTFTARCKLTGHAPQISCDPTPGLGNQVELGTARVRYEYDPGYSPEADRARVPKVVSWQLNR